VVSPQDFDEAVGGDDPAPAEQEGGQQGTLLLAGDVESPPAGRGSHRAQQAELQRLASGLDHACALLSATSAQRPRRTVAGYWPPSYTLSKGKEPRMEPTEILKAARSALAETQQLVTGMIRALPDASAPVPGSDWTVRDTAVHLAHGARLYVELATGAPSPYPDLRKETIAAFCAEFIADIPETDPGKLAALVGDAYDGFLDVTAGRPGEQEVRYHGGLPYDLGRLACVLLGEAVIHGYDMATALGQPWPIDPVHAQLVLHGYGPAYGQCLNPATTAGLCATYGIEVRGGGSLTVSFVDGHYQLVEGISGPVDCEISADPVAFLLVGAGRVSRFEAVALGLLSLGGAKPELALGFPDLFVFP
jgi:uncharacterized protein (TIGR03083 family)